MDIIILRLIYPNDPTHNLTAHQHFVCELTDSCINLYSVSSILGKEERVFDKDGNVKEEYEVIDSTEINKNGFKSPSFIDCTKMYSIKLDKSANVALASHRNIEDNLKDRIRNRIHLMIEKGKHTTYSISLEDLKQWNNRIVLNE